MIRYLSGEEKERSRPLYREAFPEDKEAFVEYYYHYVTRDNRILVLEQEGEICSMIHLNPYRLSVKGKPVDAYYYVAVATKKSCRHQGMMRRLLESSLRDLWEEGHPFAYLMPADRAIYEPFDFRIVYEQKKLQLPPEPEKANEAMNGLFDVYTLRDDRYMEKLQAEERACAGEEPFDITPYIMMRVVCVEKMLELLRSGSPKRYVLTVTDPVIPGNNAAFFWEAEENKSRCRKLTEEEKPLYLKEFPEISTGIAELTEFVFGRRTIEGLEEIRALQRICINEAV